MTSRSSATWRRSPEGLGRPPGHPPRAGPSGLTPADRQKRLRTALLYQNDELWQVEGRGVVDPHRVAWVEAPPAKLAGLAGSQGVGSEPVRVIEGDDPTRVELEVTLAIARPRRSWPTSTIQAGRLELDGRPAEILRRQLRAHAWGDRPRRVRIGWFTPIGRDSLVVGVGLIERRPAGDGWVCWRSDAPEG